MRVLKPLNLIPFVCCVFLLLCYHPVKAQVAPARQMLLNLKAQADSSIKKFAPERVFLQFDRPYYSVGDTIWFKGWLVDAPSLLLSTKSGMLHVEIATDSNEVVQKFLYPLTDGITWGDIALDQKLYPPGSYIIRAYTNWMRNFSDQTFFYKRFNITGGFEDNWMVKLRTDTTRLNGQPNTKAILQFNYLDRQPVVNKPIAMQVTSGRHTLSKLTLNTELTGTVDISFKPPQSSENLVIKTVVDNKGGTMNIPVNLKTAADIDLQFMPEGGSLVAGVPSKIGFKAVGVDGKGINVSGKVTDSKGNEVAELQTLNKGMGSFMLQPVAGEKYTAKIIYGSVSKAIALPKIQSAGFGIFVFNRATMDSLRVTVTAGPGNSKQPETYFLIAKTRGVVGYASLLNFDKGNEVTSNLSKNLFPTGVTHIILTDAKGRTLNERLVFIKHNDGLKMDVTLPPITGVKDSVDLKFSVTNNAGKPAQGFFTVAVTDDARVKTDTVNDDNIATSLLLTSELRGHVETPAWYFSKTPLAWQALDDLLLTQGWVNYAPPAKAADIFPAEEDYSVSGRLTNLFGKPAAGLKINLLSLRPFYTKNTLTNANGRFKMMLPLVDTPAFILKAVKSNGKSSGLPIEVNAFRMPDFVQPNIPADLPWNVNTGDTVIRDLNANIRKRKEAEKMPDGTRLLQGVTVMAKKIVKNSRNPNGPGNADLVLDEKDMQTAGKKTLFDLINEKIEGLHIQVPYKQGPRNGGKFGADTLWYFIKRKEAVFVIDGTDLKFALQAQSYIDIKRYLETYTAESIKGLELSYTPKYNFSYLSQFEKGFTGGIAKGQDITRNEYAFIEITTRSGQGPLIPSSKIYLYKPLPLSVPSEFYKPKYTAATTAFENRPTIAWEPNVVTDAEGKATIGFRAGVTPGNYTIVIQGIGIDGGLGVKYIPMKVGAAAP